MVFFPITSVLSSLCNKKIVIDQLDGNIFPICLFDGFSITNLKFLNLAMFMECKLGQIFSDDDQFER